MPVSFETIDVDREIIRKIASRAVALGKTKGGDPNPLYVIKAITATHATGCRLDLQRFLDADDIDFAHDLIGIFRHLDRTTGRLRNSFCPRSALAEPPLPEPEATIPEMEQPTLIDGGDAKIPDAIPVSRLLPRGSVVLLRPDRFRRD
jgi:hypothetical protein